MREREVGALAGEEAGWSKKYSISTGFAAARRMRCTIMKTKRIVSFEFLSFETVYSSEAMKKSVAVNK